tara:strand:+ start:1623 stop:2105 length:483 start_codon:yes stop_codon:yes gene_type:complete
MSGEKMNRIVIRWWLVFCISVLLCAIGFSFGLVNELYQKDPTRISFLILILYFCSTIYIGFSEWAIAKTKISEEHYINVRRIAWFIAESLMALGMIGTVIGFILMLGSSFESIDVSNTETLKSTLTSMAIGMSTALYTTVTGLICSLWLKTTLVVVNPGE